MARSYGKILAAIWADPDWAQLTRGAQHTYAMLISQPGLTLAGSIDLMPSRWARYAAGLTEHDVRADLDELASARFVVVDHGTSEAVVRTIVRHDFDGARVNVNLVKGLWAAWAGILSATLRKVVVDHVPAPIWDRPGASAPEAAQQMRRSPRLELPVRTSGQNWQMPLPVATTGPNHQTEPLSMSPSLSLSPVSVSEAAASRPARALPPDESTATPAAVDNSQTQPAVFDATLDLLTDRELTRNPTRNGNPDRHRAAILKGKRTDHAAQAHRYLYLNPDLTPTQLADLLEPPPGHNPANGHITPGPTPPHPRPVAEVMADYDIPADERADPDTVADVIAATRAHLAQPHATHPEDP